VIETASKAQRGRAKPVSCHTVLDDRKRSPPPPVPAGYAVTKVDVERLDEYSSSRESSQSGKVYTVKSDDCDNLSVFLDTENPLFERPKRVAQRVLKERAEAAAKLQGEGVEPPTVAAAILDVPSFPAEVLPKIDTGVGLVREDPTSAGVRRLGSVVHGVRSLHHHLGDTRKSRFAVPLQDDELGYYIHYHDMDKAETSNYFLRGVDSITQFVDHDGRDITKGLPKQERLYAMRCLVEACNGSTAIAMGIQRLFDEISKRDGDEFQKLVDVDKMVDVLQWMTTECGQAQARVRLYRDIMPFFMDYDIDRIPPATELEQRVMLQMMDKFNNAAVKKDPDKLSAYVRALNSKPVTISRVGSRGVRRAVTFK